MKVMLLAPKIYPFTEMLFEGFIANNCEPIICDYRAEMPYHLNRLYDKTWRLPKKINSGVKDYYFKMINKIYIKNLEMEQPELIVIYNNQFAYPDTIKAFKKSAKIIFFLGDNPLWSKIFDYNLSILIDAEMVLVPDSHWKFELEMIGISNVFCDHIGYSKKHFYQDSNVPGDIKKRYDSDLLFIGNSYNNSVGCKRAMLLNNFAGMKLKIFGNKAWEDWLHEFPLLEPHFTLISERISNVELNQAINCTKIYPVDQNTGITNGIHARVFEAIGAGALPLVEWRKDIDSVFGDLLPSVKCYGEAREMAAHYLKSETLRKEKIIALQKHIENKYNPKLYVKRILERLELNG